MCLWVLSSCEATRCCFPWPGIPRRYKTHKMIIPRVVVDSSFLHSALQTHPPPVGHISQPGLRLLSSLTQRRESAQSDVLMQILFAGIPWWARTWSRRYCLGMRASVIHCGDLGSHPGKLPISMCSFPPACHCPVPWNQWLSDFSYLDPQKEKYFT